jgi:hypothetical protein
VICTDFTDIRGDSTYHLLSLWNQYISPLMSVNLVHITSYGCEISTYHLLSLWNQYISPLKSVKSVHITSYVCEISTFSGGNRRIKWKDSWQIKRLSSCINCKLHRLKRWYVLISQAYNVFQGLKSSIYSKHVSYPSFKQ